MYYQTQDYVFFVLAVFPFHVESVVSCSDVRGRIWGLRIPYTFGDNIDYLLLFLSTVFLFLMALKNV